MPKEMHVAGLAIDPATQSPVVILRDRENRNTVPIWIGVLEANAIAVALENFALPRPMTHDLFKNVMDQFGIRLRRVEVTDIREGTYYAALHLTAEGKSVVVDSRPSDAIAIALRAGIPIEVREEVIQKAGRPDADAPAAGEKDKWTELLEKLDPGDFSKYKM